MSKPIIDSTFLIEKMEGKGAWSYVLLPIKIEKSGLPFGWYIVKGTIDDYEIEQYKLWPTKEGKAFLPIKAAIRKKIKKQAGDRVKIVLWNDVTRVEIPEDFELTLEDFPSAKAFFHSLTATNQKQYIDYIIAPKSIDARVRRMTKTIEKLEQGLKYHENEER